MTNETKPAAPQQGEYPVWPESTIFDGVDRTGNPVSHGYSATQVNELFRSDRAARGAAQAAPASNDDSLTLDRLVSALDEAERNGALHFSLECPLQEAREAIEANQQAQPAPVAEDVESFDAWLVKQSEFRNYYFDQRGPGLMAVPFARRAYEAGQAAQPAPVAEDVEDAARWREFQTGKPLVVKMKKSAVIYGPNPEAEFPEALNKAVDAARAQAAQPEGGAK